MNIDMIDLSELYDEPIDPSSIQYRAVPARVKAPKDQPDRACAGCLFKGQRNKVCVQAGQLARVAGMPDCEDVDQATGKTFIYLARETDPRQLSIIEGEKN